MGSSARKKKEKKKDFQVSCLRSRILIVQERVSDPVPAQKTKLKVGKAKPKSDNFTDTSFKAKGMSVTVRAYHFAAA